jgi:hypothetical protein
VFAAYCAAVRSSIDRGDVDLDAALDLITEALANGRGLTAHDVGFDLDERLAQGVSGFPTLPPQYSHGGVLGSVYEALLSPMTRRHRGAHFTPAEVARRLAAAVLTTSNHAWGNERTERDHTICDPTCGGGAFLLAAAEALLAEAERAAGQAGESPDREAIVRRLWGADRDPQAVVVTRRVLRLWAGAAIPQLDAQIVVADTLLQGPDTVWGALLAPFDLVLGNPPFLNQLGSATARAAADGALVHARFGSAAKGYVDTSALFLLVGLELARPGGLVCLLQPQSLLAAAGAEPTRVAVSEQADLVGLWFGRDTIFDASVRVVAPLIRRGEPANWIRSEAPVRRWVGAAVEPVAAAPAPGPKSWSALVTDLLGVPPLGPARTSGTLASVATATAGFRDQFYGLVPAVYDDAGSANPRLATVGLIDPLHIAWGSRPVRFAGRRLAAPSVDPTLINPRIRGWVEARLGPKVLVATQTRVIEAAVDPVGQYVPATPLISLHADADRLWHVAAVLTNPYTTAMALHGTFGTALVSDALKLSATQVLALPLPADRETWDLAAALAESAARHEGAQARCDAVALVGLTMLKAYGLDDPELYDWWRRRLSPASPAPR